METNDILTKIAFWGEAIKGIKNMATGLGGRIISNPGHAALTIGLGTVLPGFELASKFKEGWNRGAKNFGNKIVFNRSFKLGGLNINEKDLSSEMIDLGPMKAAKLALFALSNNPNEVTRLARVDEEEAVKIASKDFLDLTNLFLTKSASKIDKLSMDKGTKEIYENVSMFNSKKSLKNERIIKFADYILKGFFPTLRKNRSVKLAWLMLSTCPEEMQKVAFEMSPDAINKIRNMALITAATTGALIGTQKITESLNQFSKDKVIDNVIISVKNADPSLNNYDEESLRKVVYDIYRIAPDVLRVPSLSAHYIKQILETPSGGLSLDFLDKLTKTQNNLGVSAESQAKLLNTGLGTVKSLLNF